MSHGQGLTLLLWLDNLGQGTAPVDEVGSPPRSPIYAAQGLARGGL